MVELWFGRNGQAVRESFAHAAHLATVQMGLSTEKGFFPSLEYDSWA
jgi:hypothetical protein